MKRALPVFACLVFIASGVRAQTLEITEWLACNVYPDTTYLKFQDDTIYFLSPANPGFEEYAAISTYQLIADTLEWTDLELPNKCDPAIVGRYLYQIDNGKLEFDLLQDDCSFRRDVVSILELKASLTVGTSDPKPQPFRIYPNPIGDGPLAIEASNGLPYRWQLYTSTGRPLRVGEENGPTDLELDDLASGMYYLVLVEAGGRSHAFPLVKP